MKLCINCKEHITTKNWICTHCNWQPIEHLGYITFSPELAFANDGFNVEDFATLHDLEGKHFWFNSRNYLIKWALERYCNNVNVTEGNFLEIGCGTGFVLSYLQRNVPSTQFFGSDIYVESLKFVRERCKDNTELFQMDARNIPFKEKFNIIGAFDVLEHIKEDEQVISEISKALTPRGELILTVPQHQWCWSVTDEYAHHVRRYNRYELQEKLEKSGFEVILNISFVTFLLPLVIISRLFKNKDNYMPTNELKLAKMINFLFSIVMKIEKCLIKMGFRFPFGSSCLIVAKKKG